MKKTSPRMITAIIPQQFKPQLEVVSCYIEYDGQILLLQRHKEHKHSLKWGLPAGKREKSETQEQAIIREIKEETGLGVTEKQLTYREVLFVAHQGKEFLYHVFHTSLTQKPQVQINPPEHRQYGWFTTQQALTVDLIHDLDVCIERHYGLVKAVA